MKGLFTLFFIASLTLALVDENKPAGDIAESKKTDITIKTDKGQSIKINTDKLNNQVFGRSTRGVLSRKSHFGRKAQEEEVTGEEAPAMEKDGEVRQEEESASSETAQEAEEALEKIGGGVEGAEVVGEEDGVVEEEISLGDLADNAGTILDNAEPNENGNFIFTPAQVETLKAAIDALESLIEIAPDDAADEVEIDIPEDVVEQGVKEEAAEIEEAAAEAPATGAEEEGARRRHRRFRRHAMVKRFAHRFHSRGFSRKQFVKARPHNHHRWVVHP